MFIRAPAVRRGGMGDLTFVGLGLQDEKGVTLLGLDVARAADVVFGEFYTSVLPGARLDALESLIGKRIRVLSRHHLISCDDRPRLSQTASRDQTVAAVVPGTDENQNSVLLRLRSSAQHLGGHCLAGTQHHLIVAPAAGIGCLLDPPHLIDRHDLGHPVRLTSNRPKPRMGPPQMAAVSRAAISESPSRRSRSSLGHPVLGSQSRAA